MISDNMIDQTGGISTGDSFGSSGAYALGSSNFLARTARTAVLAGVGIALSGSSVFLEKLEMPQYSKITHVYGSGSIASDVKYAPELLSIVSNNNSTAEKFRPDLLAIVPEDDLTETLRVARQAYPMALNIDLFVKEDYEEDQDYLCVNISMPASVDSVLAYEIRFIESLSGVSQETFERIVTSYTWV